MKKRNSFVPGQPRPANAGRKAGTPNKRTQELMTVLEELNVNPVRALVDLLPQLDFDKQADVYIKLLDYIYPKRKAIEVTGANGDPLIPRSPLTQEERLELVARAREVSE